VVTNNIYQLKALESVEPIRILDDTASGIFKENDSTVRLQTGIVQKIPT
jgi:hypothetical protein